MTHPQAPARPDDAAKQAAGHAYDTITAFGWNVSWYSQNPIPDDAWPIDIIALAIMAATAAQRERDAKIAVARSDHKRAHCDDACVCDNGYHVALAIRAGS